MTLADIALVDLRRRKAKAAFVLAGPLIGNSRRILRVSDGLMVRDDRVVREALHQEPSPRREGRSR